MALTADQQVQLMQKLQETLDELDSKDEQLNAVLDELEQKDADLGMAGKIGEQLLEKTQALEEELAALRQRELDAEVGGGDGGELREQNELLRRKHDRAASNFKQAQLELDEKDAEIARLEQRVQEQRRRIAHSQALARGDARQSGHDSDGSDADSELDTLRDQKSALEREVKTLRQSMSRANKSAAVADRTINELYSELAAKDDTTSDLRSQLTSVAAQVTKLEMNEIDLQALHARAEAAAQAECNKLQKINHALQQQLEDAVAAKERAERGGTEASGLDAGMLGLELGESSDDEANMGLGDLHMGADGGLGSMREVELEAEVDRLKAEVSLAEQNAAATHAKLESQIEAQKEHADKAAQETEAAAKAQATKAREREDELRRQADEAATEAAQQITALQEKIQVRAMPMPTSLQASDCSSTFAAETGNRDIWVCYLISSSEHRKSSSRGSCSSSGQFPAA